MSSPGDVVFPKCVVCGLSLPLGTNENDHFTIQCREVMELKQTIKFLDALEANGVDNWEGYIHAQEMARDED